MVDLVESEMCGRTRGCLRGAAVELIPCSQAHASQQWKPRIEELFLCLEKSSIRSLGLGNSSRFWREIFQSSLGPAAGGGGSTAMRARSVSAEFRLSRVRRLVFST